ncbi:MAG: zinc-binding dehydrogenase [Pseudomonadota bacterium]
MAVAPADRIAALPDGMDPHLAAALPQSGAIALAAVKELKNGQRLLVIGAGGGTGALLLPMAREIAGHITAVDSAEKSSVMMQLGADVTIDYRQTDFTKTGENWDCIIDLAATRTAWQVRKSLSEHGRYIVFGGAMKSLLTALATPKCSVGQADGSPRVLQQLSDLFSDGRLMPEIVSKLSLEDAASGLQDVGEGKVAGKIVVIPGTTKVGES